MGTPFSNVPRADIPRSSFKRNHGCKTTFDEGLLVPIFVDEVLPGDTMHMKMSVFARLATPLTPFMDNMVLRSYWFFVPNRLVWTNWQKFMGQQDSPGDSTDYLIPQITAPVGGAPENTLADYFGIPTNINGLVFNALPARGYQLIRNEWFRDQNLQTPTVISKADGPDTTTSMVIQRVSKRHDLFTSCLPWPQKAPSTTIPFASTNAPVTTNGLTPTYVFSGSGTNRNLTVENTGHLYISGTAPGAAIVAQVGNESGLQIASTAMGTINQLRQAFQVQKLYERDARGGTRYTEIIYSHFGVTSPDSRLQRPEYLGGGVSPININPVAQTAPTTGGSTPQGNLAAFGTVSASSHGFTKSFDEHGYVFGLVAVTADVNYQEGLERHWSYRTRLDYAWPALSHLGEVPVYNREIYAQGTAGGAADAAAFGYNEKDYQYRYKPSIITGLFRSSATGSLDTWHLAPDYSALPVLNDSFIQENAPVDRVIAVPSEPHFLFDSHFEYTCARPLPINAVPGLVDHF